jgi:hypothetical protein
MKVRLLKKLRKVNVVYQRGNEYKYVCRRPAYPSGWFIETEWTKDKQSIINKQREEILEEARHWKTYKNIV